MRLNHAHVVVADLERSRAFYSALVGFDTVFLERPDYVVLMQDSEEGTGMIGLSLGPPPAATGPATRGHFGFEFEDVTQVQAFRQRALELGCREVEFRADAEYSACRVEDPDGNEVEAYAFA
jgi:catechol 2,3-dioxygenase-like lactoylglutathione lyase family enzyme